MTKEEAIAIRQAQLNGKPVRAAELQEAIFTLSKRRDRRMALPKLPEGAMEMLNAALCLKLGRELGKKAA
jgi:hypothetical protein